MTQNDKQSVFLAKSSQQITRQSSAKPSIILSPTISTYKSAAFQYQQFLNDFQERLQKIYNKQCYRIYLNDKVNERAYKQLIKQKDDLLKALQDSKDYRQSVNRGLIQEIMNLENIKEEYTSRNKQYEKNIYEHKKTILNKKKQLKQLQAEIKSYWIYNYDITNVSVLSKRGNSSIYQNTSTNKNSFSESINCSKIKQPMTNRKDDTKQNNFKQSNSNIQNNHKNINQSALFKHKQNSIHLPEIKINNRYGSSLKTNSNASLYIEKNHKTSTFSKDLSLLNCSQTKQKILQKLQASNRLRILSKLQYERQKLNLLKMFKFYLHKKIDSQQILQQRTKLQKIVLQLNCQIKAKQDKLNQIQKLLNQ